MNLNTVSHISSIKFGFLIPSKWTKLLHLSFFKYKKSIKSLEDFEGTSFISLNTCTLVI